MGCVACNEEESITSEERPMTETETRVQNLINTYSDYDPYAVEELLTNKLLTLDAYLEYDSRWDRIVAEPYAFGVKNDPEFTPDRYLLREDGTAVHYTLEEGVWVTTEGTWSFDAASQTLRLLDQEEHIIALTPSSIIWDKETTNVPGGKPRFYRIIYKVSDYDPNQPNPTPDTVYEPIEMLLLSMEQHWLVNLEHSTQGCFIYKNEDGYTVVTNILFKGDTKCNLKENEIYLWIEDSQGRRFPQSTILPYTPNCCILFKPENLNPAHFPGYNAATDYRLEISPIFPKMGEYFLKIKIYEPATKKYYVGPDYKFTFSETDFGTYTKFEYN